MSLFHQLIQSFVHFYLFAILAAAEEGRTIFFTTICLFFFTENSIG